MSLLPLHQHPLLTLLDVLDARLAEVADVDPGYLPPEQKAAVLVGLTRAVDRLHELRLRVLNAADDVAQEHGARDAASWLAAEVRLDGREARRDQRLAEALGRRWHEVARALRAGEVNRAQAEALVRALDDLPDDLPDGVAARAEAHLVAQAGQFAPADLRALGRRVLDIVAPEVGELREQRLLEREEALAARLTRLTTRRRGDGTTDVHARVPDTVADRLLTYLHAFTSPRRGGGAPGGASGGTRHDVRLGRAFAAFLESVDPRRMPLHGGDATTVLVKVDLATLSSGLGTAVVGDLPVSAGEARRLACTAGLLPAVLGGASEVLDLGRSRRLFSPAQRKALALRDGTCRAEGCDVPAAWCEAHHAGRPWAQGGRTDLVDGVLLCSHHHHRAHDRRYGVTRVGQRLRFHRRP